MKLKFKKAKLKELTTNKTLNPKQTKKIGGAGIAHTDQVTNCEGGASVAWECNL